MFPSGSQKFNFNLNQIFIHLTIEKLLRGATKSKQVKCLEIRFTMNPWLQNSPCQIRLFWSKKS